MAVAASLGRLPVDDDTADILRAAHMVADTDRS